MEDPETWLPDFFKDRWDQAIESLRGEGEDITEPRPDIWGASDSRSGGNILEKCIVKVYESGDLTRTRVTHGDLDKDSTWAWVADVKRKLPRGDPKVRRQVHDIARVIERCLELYRRNPHPDWNMVDGINVRTVTNYGDYQHRIVSFILHRYGEVLPVRRLQAID